MKLDRFPTAAPAGELVWWPEHGMGYYPVDQSAGVYDLSYWQKYTEYDASPMGKQLTRARVDLVSRFWDGFVIDVGIGAGAFVEAWGVHTGGLVYGWDVNPTAIEWLVARNQLACPTEATSESVHFALSFWDCLEHIPEPDAMLSKARMVFVSLPIFDGPEHVLRSKHFRRDEHCWYWTRSGLIRWMAARGFECVECSAIETLIGREDIESFAFARPRA